MLDQQHDVSLYGISGRGFELAERYRDGAALTHLSEAVRTTLGAIADEREALMETFRRVVLAEGGLLKAGNPEREWLETLVDRWYSNLSGGDSVLDRLIRADHEWLEEIHRVSAANDWPAPVAEALWELSSHVDDCHRRLEAAHRAA